MEYLVLIIFIAIILLTVLGAMSDMQSRMRESYHDAASWVREGLMVRSQKPGCETRFKPRGQCPK